jgi:hypothetical protein
MRNAYPETGSWKKPDGLQEALQEIEFYQTGACEVVADTQRSALKNRPANSTAYGDSLAKTLCEMFSWLIGKLPSISSSTISRPQKNFKRTGLRCNNKAACSRSCSLGLFSE